MTKIHRKTGLRYYRRADHRSKKIQSHSDLLDEIIKNSSRYGITDYYDHKKEWRFRHRDLVVDTDLVFYHSPNSVTIVEAKTSAYRNALNDLEDQLRRDYKLFTLKGFKIRNIWGFYLFKRKIRKSPPMEFLYTKMEEFKKR